MRHAVTDGEGSEQVTSHASRGVQVKTERMAGKKVNLSLAPLLGERAKTIEEFYAASPDLPSDASTDTFIDVEVTTRQKTENKENIKHESAKIDETCTVRSTEENNVDHNFYRTESKSFREASKKIRDDPKEKVVIRSTQGHDAGHKPITTRLDIENSSLSLKNRNFTQLFSHSLTMKSRSEIVNKQHKPLVLLREKTTIPTGKIDLLPVTTLRKDNFMYGNVDLNGRAIRMQPSSVWKPAVPSAMRKVKACQTKTQEPAPKITDNHLLSGIEPSHGRRIVSLITKDSPILPLSRNVSIPTKPKFLREKSLGLGVQPPASASKRRECNIPFEFDGLLSEKSMTLGTRDSNRVMSKLKR